MTSVLIAASFLILVVSGVVLFLSPPGRVANWSGWRMLGFTKMDWTGLHVWFGTLFLLAAILHLFFNLRPMLSCFKDRMTRRVGFRWEWVVALAVTGAVFAGTRAGVPPFSTFLAFQEGVKQSWEDPRERAPIPHAELLTVKELAEKAGATLESALQRLEANQVRGASADVVVAELAGKNRVTGQRVYEIIRGPDSGGKGRGSSGMGPGRMTLQQFCESREMDLQTAQAKLREKGIQATPDQTMWEIATQNNLASPHDLMDLIGAQNP